MATEKKLIDVDISTSYNSVFVNDGGRVRQVNKDILKNSTIVNIDDTTSALELLNDTEYRFNNNVASLTLTIPSNMTETYASYIVFTSGETATEIIYPDSLKWSGDDVVDGVFTPMTSHRYNIGIWYDGAEINAVSRSVSI